MILTPSKGALDISRMVISSYRTGPRPAELHLTLMWVDYKHKSQTWAINMYPAQDIDIPYNLHRSSSPPQCGSRRPTCNLSGLRKDISRSS
jgi:hypothetical protein